MAQFLSAFATALPYIESLAGGLLSRKSAEDSSALQYKYQSMLNKQNYGYNTALINMQNAFNEAMMDKANTWNLDRWNESVDLANTAHQRQVADLKKAGLNPILSANGGASVVNPIQSAQASSGNSQLSSSAGMPDVDYLRGISTAIGIRNENRRVENELENSKTQREFTQEQTLKTKSDAEVNQANSASQIAKNNVEIEKLKSDIKNNRELTKAQVKKLQSDEQNNYSNSARTQAETTKIKNDVEHYEVHRGIHLGKFGTVGIVTHPNEKHKVRDNIQKTQHYEFIGGKKVLVTSYDWKKKK